MTERINPRQPLFRRFHEEYRERRYLKTTPDAELIQRARDLITNALNLTPGGKTGMQKIDTPHAAFIMRLFSHLLEEWRLRPATTTLHYPPPSPTKNSPAILPREHSMTTSR